MERKTLAIGIIVIVAIAAGATGAVIYFMTAPPGEGEQIISVGQMYLPFTIDPQDAWDQASNNVIVQVVEGLLTYDWTDPALPKIPRLATALGTWDSTFINYTVNLKTGVTFHDGSAFDADDVVFTWKRQQWLYNFTGLNNGYVPDVYELYSWPDHTPIIKEVHAVSQYQVIYELNRVYGPFEDLLCYAASSILTDTYYNETGGIVELDGDIVGTGPFMYESYEEDVEVIMLAYDNYHRGKPKLDKVIYVGIISAQARTAALFAGDIQYLYQPMDEMWSSIEGASGLTLWAPEDRVSSGLNYLAMNNIQINRTWREAISYAYNYEYQIDTIRYGHGTRLKSPIGVGIKYHNGSLPAPIFNLTYAREVVQSMGFGTTFNVSEDDEWTAQTASVPFLTLNYSYNIGNDVREKTFIMLIANLAKIGIRVTDAGSTWSIVLQKIYELGGHDRNEVQLLFIGWGADFNDPCNFINPLFTNRSVASNSAQYNGYTEAAKAGRDEFDTWDNVQLLMEAALGMPDGAVRESYYNRMQELLLKDMPWVFAFSSQGPAWAHPNNVKGISYNAQGTYDFFPVYFE
ncbi:MAG: ABC transporter substrate-binding protein [Promethearchaeota archaeon]